MSSAYFPPAAFAGAVSLVSQARSPDERLESLQRLISEAHAEIADIEAAPRIFTAELEHPRHGIYKIGVDPDTLDGTTGSLMDISLALLTSAASIAAGRSIDPRSFDTQLEHEAAVAKRAASFQIIGIRHSDDASRWFARGTTSQGEAFETYVHAVDEQEADFQARWYATTLKSRAAIDLETLPAFLGSLYEVTLELVEPRPVDLAELASASAGLVAHIRAISEAERDAAIISSEPFALLEDMLSKIAKAGVAAAFQRPTAAAAPTIDTSAPAEPAMPEDDALSAPLVHTETREASDNAAGEPEYRQAVNIDLP